MEHNALWTQRSADNNIVVRVYRIQQHGIECFAAFAHDETAGISKLLGTSVMLSLAGAKTWGFEQLSKQQIR